MTQSPNKSHHETNQTAGSDDFMVILPPSGKRKKPIRIRAVFCEDVEKNRQVDEAVCKVLVRMGVIG